MLGLRSVQMPIGSSPLGLCYVCIYYLCVYYYKAALISLSYYCLYVWSEENNRFVCFV